VNSDSVILAPRVRLIAATAVLVLFVAAVPELAAAQDDGVFFDPGGPSEKEYAVPHEQARGGGDAPSSGDGGGSGGASQGGEAQDGDTGASGAGEDSSDAPLFGEGVSRPKGDRSAEGQAGARRGSESAVGISPASTNTNATTGLGWFALIAAGVALAGGGLAYLIRARTRGPAS
jgi:hypothetical protein